MKTFDEILKSHYLHPLSKLEKEWIYSAMREACEQAIDECAEIKISPNKKAEEREKYHLEGMTNDYDKSVPTDFAALCCGNSFVEGSEWSNKEMKQSILNVKKILK